MSLAEAVLYGEQRKRAPVNMFPWNAEQVAELRSLHAAGHSFNTIAMMMGGGLTRNAVIGKAKRIGLVRRIKRTAPLVRLPREPRRRMAVLKAHDRGGAKQIRMRLKARKNVAAALPPVIAKPPLHLVLMDLTSRTCKWPFGEKAPYSFCGHETAPGRSYCATHLLASVNIGTQRDFDRIAARCLAGKLHDSKTVVME